MKINIAGVELYYEKIGHGKPLIFLHGNQEDLSIFDILVKGLDNQFTCYLIDSRNHGKSMQNLPFSYEEMANDIFGFITQLDIKKPSIIGFSDGGIIGLLIAIKHPHILDKLITCGANLNPEGIKIKFQKMLRCYYEDVKSPYFNNLYLKLMLDEPHITHHELAEIICPTLVLAGQNDIVKRNHTQEIHQHITRSKMKIIPNQSHDSYIVHSDLIKGNIIEFCI